MNISGIIVCARPERAEQVRRTATDLPGVEVHALTKEGRLVVTIEGEDTQELADVHQQLSRIDGVFATAVVYHHFEPDHH
jgi:nitrate reductase NapD